MSTGLIIAIVVVVVIALVAALLLSPQARVRRRERELGQRRERAVDTHRTEAATRERQAVEAEKRAQVATAEAQRQRAEAELHQARAGVHEQGLADHELVEPSERERFAGTSAVPEGERTAEREETGPGAGPASAIGEGADGAGQDERSGDYRTTR